MSGLDADHDDGRADDDFAGADHDDVDELVDHDDDPAVRLREPRVPGSGHLVAAVAMLDVPGRRAALGRRIVPALTAAFLGACTPMAPPLERLEAPWLLIAPPTYYRDGGARMADRAPLWDWVRLGGFADGDECSHYRDDRIGHASDDEEWAMWSKSRCETAARAAGPRLTADELTTQ